MYTTKKAEHSVFFVFRLPAAQVGDDSTQETE